MVMNIRSMAAAAGTALLMWPLPALAHHSFSAQYDADKPIEVKGAVTRR